jgi:hypothetical protein
MTDLDAKPGAAAMTDAEFCGALNRRPRDLDAYREACEAADDDDVEEITAAGVCAGMTVRHDGRWLQVKTARHTETATVLDFMVAEAGATASRVTGRSTLMYRRYTERERARG